MRALKKTFSASHDFFPTTALPSLASLFIASTLLFTSACKNPTSKGGVLSTDSGTTASKPTTSTFDGSLTVSSGSSNPASPSNSSTNPYIKGTANSKVDTVVLFSDQGCSTEITRGSRSDFEGSGIQISVTDNKKTYVYGLGLQASTENRGNCTPLVSYTHDSIAPTVSVGTPSKTNVNSTHTITSKITFTDANTVSLTANGITLNTTGTATCTKAISGSGAIYRTLTLTSCTGDGTVTYTVPASAGSDLAGNTSAAATSSSITVDNSPPTITISAPSSSAVNSSATVTYTVTYAGATSVTLAASDVTLNTTGGATCSKAVSGTGTATRTVTLTSCTGDGTMGISIASGTAKDDTANLAAAAGPSTTFIVDNTAPTISGVTSSTANGYYKEGQDLSIQVGFSESVTVASGTPTLTFSTGSNAVVNYASGSSSNSLTFTYTIASGQNSSDLDYVATSSFDVAGATIIDAAQNTAVVTLPSPGAANSLSSNKTLVVDTVAPTVSVGAPSTSLVNSGTNVTYTVTYTGVDSSITLAAGDVTLNTTGNATCSKAVSGAGLSTRTVTLSSCTGDGTVGITISAGSAVDLAGNLATASSASSTFTVDNTAPTLAVSAPSATVVKSSATVTYTVTYTGVNNSITLAAGDVSLNTTGNATCSKAVSGTGLATRTVTLTSCTGDGTVGITIAASTASDLAGNLASASSASTTFTVDNTAPTLALSAPSVSVAKSTASITYTVTYTGADNAITLTAADVSLNTTGNATCSKAVSGAGLATRTVTLTSCTGDGTVGITIGASTASDLAGNLAAASSASTTFTVDNTAPTLALSAPSVSYAKSSASITYTVTYTGVDNAITLASGDISLNTTGNATCSKAVSGAGLATRTVTLTSCTGDGTVGITIAASTASDLAGNLAAASSASTTFTVDNTAPTLALSAPSASYANSSASITYTVTYTGVNNEITLASGDVSLNTTGNATCSKAVSGAGLATRTVTLTSCTGDGTVGVTIGASTASDLAGNLAAASSASTTFTVDNTAPTLAVSAPSVSYAKSSASITYTVTYTGVDNAITLASGDISLNTTGNATCSKAVSGAGLATRTVTLTSCTGDGTVGITIAASTASDLAGNLAAASSASTTFTVDNTAPTLAVSAPSASIAKSTTTVTYTVTYTGVDNEVTLASGDVSLNTTGNATCSKAVSGSGLATRTVTLTSCTGDGTVGVTIAASTASDLAGNLAAASSASTTFTVDNTAPNASSALAWTAGAASNSGYSTSTTITSGWTKSNSADLSNQKVKLYTDGTCTSLSSVSDLSSAALETKEFTGKTHGTTYSFMIESIDTAGNSTSSACSSGIVIDTSAPSAATTLAWTPGAASSSGYSTSTSFTAGWTVSASGDLLNQKIKLFNDGTCSNLSSVTDLSSAVTATKAYVGSNGTTYSFMIESEDNAGNKTTTACSSGIIVDTTVPTLAIGSPSSSLINGSSSSAFTVTYTGVDNSITLAAGNVTLNTTGDATCSKAVSGTGTTTRTVTLSSCTGNGTVGITIAAGTATDLAGNATAASSASATFTVDTTAPSAATSLVWNPNSTYSTSTSISANWTVSASGDAATQSVLIFESSDCSGSHFTGSPFSIANNTTAIKAITGVNGTTYAFKITTTDTAGNSTTTACSSALTVDTTAATITNTTSSTADGYYNEGDSISIQVTFSETVTVSGTPFITLNSGGGAQYTSGSNSATLTFTYVVGAGETAADLEYTSTSALDINGGDIEDLAGNNATLTLVATGTPGPLGSLGGNKAIIIDTTAPAAADTLAWTAGAASNAGYSTSTTITAGWVKSASADLYNQKVKLYADGTCTNLSSTSTLGDATTLTKEFTGSNGTTYSFKIESLDQAGNQTNSACSAGIVIDTSSPAAASSLTFSPAGNACPAGVCGANTNATNVTALTASFTKSADADLSVQKVVLYANGTCTNAPSNVYTVTVGANPQTQAFTGSNATTYSYKVESIDTAGNSTYTSCISTALSVDTTAPSAPGFTSITPTSPNSSGTPVIIGTAASSDTNMVGLYSDSSCSANIGSGTASAFTSTGITATIPENSTVTIYAKVMDYAGNPSAGCTELTTYVRSAPPPPPAFAVNASSGYGAGFTLISGDNSATLTGTCETGSTLTASNGAAVTDNCSAGTTWSVVASVANGALTDQTTTDLTLTLTKNGGTTTTIIPITYCNNLNAMPSAAAYGGSGTSGDPYTIASVAQLTMLSNDVLQNKENAVPFATTVSKYFKLSADIDMKCVDWTPIGDNANYKFKGFFDGNNKTIKNLVVNKSGTNYIGLFGFVEHPSPSGADKAVVNFKNLTLKSATIIGNNYVGGLFGYAYFGLFSGIVVNGRVLSGGTTGASGLFGGSLWAGQDSSVATATIATSNTTGMLVHTGNSSSASGGIGGFIGVAEDSGSMPITIDGDWAKVYVNSNSYYSGGFIGRSNLGDAASYIKNSYATGNVAGWYYAGGFIGRNTNGALTSNYATGTVTLHTDMTNGNDIGGFAGELAGTSGSVTKCYATGSVTGLTSSSFRVGGFAGSINAGSPAVISKSYATGAATGKLNVGGFVGQTGNETTSSIQDCYASGVATANTNSAGGFAGSSYNSTITRVYSLGVPSSATLGFLIGDAFNATITYSYGGVWDGSANINIVGNGTNTATGSSRQQDAGLKTQATYDNSWDFTNVWSITDGSTYPSLRSMP